MGKREQWLELRKKGIGGSDAAGIIGCSKYKTPFTVWADKTGRLPEKEDTEAMRQGRDLEEYVARRFAESTGLKARRDNRTITNTEYPYSFAHIDRRIAGISAGLECKTYSPYRLDSFRDGMYPPEYYAQCLHYLAVTGWEKWYLAVVVFGTAFYFYEIRREDVYSDMEFLQNSIKFFWENHVLTGIPPEPDGLDATTHAINEVFKGGLAGTVDLSSYEGDLVKLARLNDEAKELKHMQEFHKQRIKLALGENEYGECGCFSVKWKNRKDGARVFSLKFD